MTDTDRQWEAGAFENLEEMYRFGVPAFAPRTEPQRIAATVEELARALALLAPAGDDEFAPRLA